MTIAHVGTHPQQSKRIMKCPNTSIGIPLSCFPFPCFHCRHYMTLPLHGQIYILLTVTVSFFHWLYFSACPLSLTFSTGLRNLKLFSPAHRQQQSLCIPPDAPIFCTKVCLLFSAIDPWAKMGKQNNPSFKWSMERNDWEKMLIAASALIIQSVSAIQRRKEGERFTTWRAPREGGL